MGLPEELERLAALHRAGTLSDEEFARAKAALLSAPPDVSGAPAVPPTARATADPAAREKEERQWAMFVHLSLLSGLVVPLAGFVVPIVLWQARKAEMPSVDPHGKVVVNWMISAVLYGVVSVALAFVVVGIPLLVALGVVSLVFPIVGAVKANDGRVWAYPLSIPFLR